MNKGPPNCAVVIESKVGWILSGENGTLTINTRYVSSNSLTYHATFVSRFNPVSSNPITSKGSFQKI